MKSRDLLSMAGRNLLRRKSRTILTILSVVIGAISIILMLSLGFGLNREMEKNLKQYGSLTVLGVMPTRYYDPNDTSSRAPKDGVITKKIAEEIGKWPHVERVLPTRSTQGQVRLLPRKKGYDIWADIRVVDFSRLQETDLTLGKGRLPKNDKSLEVLISENLEVVKTSSGREMRPEPVPDFDFFHERMIFRMGYKDENLAMQSGVRTYEDLNASVVGSYKSSDLLRPFWGIYISEESYAKLAESMEKLEKRQQDAQGPAPEQMANKPPVKKNKEIYYDDLRVKVDSMESVDEIATRLKDEYKLEVQSNTDWIQSSKDSARNIQLLLAGIGSVALLVATIGISNTMLMSIYERTKEIGVMKVIGAQVRDVRRLFLVEAMLIGFFGGLIGVGASYGLSALINHLVAAASSGSMDMAMVAGEASAVQLSYIPIWLPVVALIFSALIGLLAGYVPARRATKLSAIDAIRSNG